MTTTRVLAGLVSNGNILADGTITPAEIGIINISGVTYPGDDQAANPDGGQTITINGAGFLSTPTVYVGGVIAPSVSFISSTQITFTSPAKTAGTYDIYVVNPSGSTAIRVYGISYSGTPTWTTPAGELGPVDANFTIQLVAAGDAPVTYALTSGSTLPSGVTLSSAGLITGSALTVEQTFNFSVDAIDGQAQETPRSFAVTVSLADPYFRYVSLLLSGDPLVTPFDADASTNNFDLTVNGDARSDNFTPYRGDGYYGNVFDGADDRLTMPASANFAFGTGDFTIEAWITTTTWAGERGFLQTSATTGGLQTSYTNGIILVLDTSGRLNANVANTNIISSLTIERNIWYHVAVTRASGSVRIFQNGVLAAGPTTVTANLDGQNLVIGGYYSTSYLWNGSVSNLRIVKGTAVYTSAFTPTTTPLTAISGTSILTCQSNRFIDTSANAVALTVVGNPAISASQPFTLPSNIATYGSGYFDGSGDYLSVPSNTAFQMGSGNFTVECWAYMNGAAQQFFFGQWNTPNRSWVFLLKNSGTTLSFTYSTTGSNELQVDGTITAQAGRWAHFAAVRNGNTLTTYMNGVVVATGSVTGVTLYSATQAIEIGRNPEATSTWNFSGYTTDIRVVKGTAVYTAAFTPPTAPLTAISGTSLLTTQYNGAVNNSVFRDSSQNNFPVTRNGNTTQGTFSPYGANWSNYFDGSGDYLQVSSTPFDFSGGADFTLEFFMYIPAGVSYGFIYQNYSTSSGITGQSINAGSDFVGFENWNGGDQSPTFALSGTTIAGQWNHVALVRSGSGTNNISLYINGTRTQQGTLTSFTAPSQTSTNIGARNYLGYKNYLTGYISNLRIVKGTGAALYSGATITVPTAALTAVPNTVLLMCGANRLRDASSNNYSITRTGDVSVQRFSPFAPSAIYATSIIGGSTYLDGTGDYLATSNTPANFGSNNFTIEGWFNFDTTTSGYRAILMNSGTGDYQGWVFYFETNNLITWNSSSNGSNWDSSIQYGTALAPNQWYHLAVVRNGTTVTMYVNGVSVGTTTRAVGYSIHQPSGSFNVGYYAYFPGGARHTKMYASDVRLVNGTAVYTANFTPPTAPLTPTTSTQLLLSNTNSGVYDSAMMTDWETLGGAQINTAYKKYGGGSISMLASGDYCKGMLPSIIGDISGGDFTIEFWVSFTSVAASRALISKYGNTAENAGGLGYVLQFQQSIPSLRFVLGTGSTDSVYDFPWSPVVNTWYHVAITRSGASGRAFVNGTQIGSTTTFTTSDVASPNGTQIGKTHTVAQYLLGYMDDVRVTKGYARYTANFTPPTAPFKGK